MPYKDPEKQRKYSAEYKAKKKIYDRERYLAEGRAQYQKNKDKHREWNKAWAKRNPDRRKELNHKYTVARRMKVLSHYSNGSMECACCGENELNFLTIDHINNDGYKTRRTIRGARMYSWIIKNNYPAVFQVLCYNCNCSKGFYGECPHETRRKLLAKGEAHE